MRWRSTTSVASRSAQKNWEEAIGYFKEALRIRDDASDTYYYLASALEAIGQTGRREVQHQASRCSSTRTSPRHTTSSASCCTPRVTRSGASAEVGASLRLAPTAPEPKELAKQIGDPAEFAKQALALYASDPEAALEAATIAFNLDPRNNVAAGKLKAKILLEQGHKKAALAGVQGGRRGRTRTTPRSVAAVKRLSPKTGTTGKAKPARPPRPRTDVRAVVRQPRRGVPRDQTTHPTDSSSRQSCCLILVLLAGLLRLLPRDQAALVQSHRESAPRPRWPRPASSSRSAGLAATGCSGRSASRSSGPKVYVVGHGPAHDLRLRPERPSDRQVRHHGNGHAALHRPQPQGRQPLRHRPAQARDAQVQPRRASTSASSTRTCPRTSCPSSRPAGCSGRRSRSTSRTTARCTSPRYSRGTACSSSPQMASSSSRSATWASSRTRRKTPNGVPVPQRRAVRSARRSTSRTATTGASRCSIAQGNFKRIIVTEGLPRGITALKPFPSDPPTATPGPYPRRRHARALRDHLGWREGHEVRQLRRAGHARRAVRLSGRHRAGRQEQALRHRHRQRARRGVGLAARGRVRCRIIGRPPICSGAACRSCSCRCSC